MNATFQLSGLPVPPVTVTVSEFNQLDRRTEARLNCPSFSVSSTNVGAVYPVFGPTDSNERDAGGRPLLVPARATLRCVGGLGQVTEGRFCKSQQTSPYN